MADARMDDMLRELDRRFEPEPAFADALLATLTAEIGFGTPRVGQRRWLPAPLARPVGLAWALVLVVLLTAVMAALVMLGNRPQGPEEGPEALVARSQAVFVAPPPFDMTSRFAEGGVVRYRFDGSTFRLDAEAGGFLDLPEGHYVVRTADQEAVYDPLSNSWSVVPNPMSSPLMQWTPSWLAPRAWEPGQDPPLETCDVWELGEEAEVAGRVADEVHCGTNRFWIDRDSGLLLKRAGGASTFDEVEVLTLELNPTFEPGVFDFEPPPGASTGDEPPPLAPTSSILEPGQPAPRWTGTLLEGGSFSTDELIGRPAAIFIWCSCSWGAEVQHFVAEARSRAGEMEMVLVGSDREGMVRGLVDWLGVETPVVGDYSGQLLRDWAIEDLSALVLLREDGTVAALHPARFAVEKLAAVLDALAAGQEIPEPDPLPDPPAPGEAVLPLSSVLEVGQPAPDLTGPLLGGGTTSTTAMGGRRTVVTFFEVPDPVTGPQTDMPPPDQLIQVMEGHAGEVNLLLVAHGEPSPGAAAAYLDRLGAEAPLVFDWDGSLARAWGLVFLPTLVLLEADGRVAGTYGMEALADPAPIVDAFVAGRALPTAPPSP